MSLLVVFFRARRPRGELHLVGQYGILDRETPGQCPVRVENTMSAKPLVNWRRLGKTVAIILLLFVIVYPYSPAGRQQRYLAAARVCRQQLRDAISKRPGLADIDRRTLMNGHIIVGGNVATEEALLALHKIVSDARMNHPDVEYLRIEVECPGGDYIIGFPKGSSPGVMELPWLFPDEPAKRCHHVTGRPSRAHDTMNKLRVCLVALFAGGVGSSSVALLHPEMVGHGHDADRSVHGHTSEVAHGKGDQLRWFRL